MADRQWISADDVVRATGGRDHPPLRQDPVPRLSEAEVRERRERAADRDWSKLEEEPKRRAPARKRRRPRFR